MEQSIVKMAKWTGGFTLKDVQHWAVFNPESGKIIGIYPGRSANEFKSKVKVEPELIEAVNRGEVQLDMCSVNLIDGELSIVQSQSLTTMDDVLHRIVEQKWSKSDDAEIFIKYSRDTKKLKISLTEKFYGKRKSKTKTSKRKIFWTDNAEMSFLITDYNDPNIIHSTVTLHLNELVGKDKVLKDVELPENFSVYTKRLFKNYVIEIS
jgi:transcriptional regulator